MMKVCRKSDGAHHVKTLPSVQKGALAAVLLLKAQPKIGK